MHFFAVEYYLWNMWRVLWRSLRNCPLIKPGLGSAATCSRCRWKYYVVYWKLVHILGGGVLFYVLFLQSCAYWHWKPATPAERLANNRSIVLLGLAFMGRHKCEVVACLSSQVKYDYYDLLYCAVYLWQINLIWFDLIYFFVGIKFYFSFYRSTVFDYTRSVDRVLMESIIIETNNESHYKTNNKG